MLFVVLYFLAGAGLALAAAGMVPDTILAHASWVQAALWAACLYFLLWAGGALAHRRRHPPEPPRTRLPWHLPLHLAAGSLLVALAFGAAGEGLFLLGWGPVFLNAAGMLALIVGGLTAIVVLARKHAPSPELPSNRGRARLTAGAITAALLFLPAFPALMGRLAAWAGGYEPEVLAVLSACSEARALLGEEVRPASWGWSCGSMETGGGSGNAGWDMPVAGSRARGHYRFTVEQHGGHWTVTGAELSVGERTVDVLSCGARSLPARAEAPSERSSPEATTLEEACGAGHAPSCVALGAKLEQGAGMTRDLVRARAFYHRACALGFQAGCLLRDKLPSP